MTKPIPLQRILFAMILSIGLVSSAFSHAQTVIAPKPLSTSFLLEFAQKLFERGEYNEAQDLLKRILKADPENPPVQRLLKTVEDQLSSKAPAVLKVSRPSEIAADIILIQKNVLVFERRNRDLEFAIRQTLQENMFLYQTLSRRNQDLLALRKKFFGYEGEGTLSSSSPVMEKTNEILNTYQEEISQRDREFTKRNQEIARMMKEVGKTDAAFKDNKEVSADMDSAANALEWKNDLMEKRSYLVEKAVTLYEKNKDLTLLHAELAAVSKSLKEANVNYGDTVSEYELKIQKLNNVWVQDKAKQQVEIDRLKEQIKNEKVKVLASRLSSGKDRETAVAEVKDAPAQTTPKNKVPKPKTDKSQSVKKGEDTDKTVKTSQNLKIDDEKAKDKKPAQDAAVDPDPQSEIKRLQAELARKEQELSERSRLFDAKIRELKSSWAQDKTISQKPSAGRTSKPSFVPSDGDPFKDSDTYRNLIQELDYIKDQLSMREKEVYKFQKEMLGHTSQVENLQKKLSQSETRLASMDALIVVKDQQIAALKKELVVKISEIREKDAQIETLKARNVSLEGLKDINKRTVDIKTPSAGADEASSSVEKLKGLVSELEGSLVAGPSSSSAEAEDLKEQLKEALETLQEKDRDIQSLRRQLEADKSMADLKAGPAGKKAESSRIKGYQENINDLKERLSVAVAQREQAEQELQEATKKLSAMMEDARQSKVQSGDTASAKKLEYFTQSIADLKGQLEKQSSDFDIQIKSLKGQLARKDKEIVDLKSRLQLKEKEVEQFYSTLEQATEKLNAKSVSRDQKPTPTVLAGQEQQQDAKDIDEQEWDPKDNDVYSLQQRLNTLSKELRFTQDELAQRTKEKGQLQNQLKEKEADSAKPLSEKDIAELENQLAAFRQQSDLTKTTIRLQQESLEKSQKEVDRKERSLKSILDQSGKLRKQIDDFKSTVKEKDEQIALQQKALDHEIKKNDTLTKKLREIQKTAIYDQERDSGKARSMTELKGNLETYEIRERDYKRQIDDIQDQLKASYVMIEDGEKRVAVLKKRLAIREERIAELQKELDGIKEGFNSSAEDRPIDQNR